MTYTVYVLPRVLQEIKSLPGNVRHRVKRTLNDLAAHPRPANSLELSDAGTPRPGVKLHRIRIEKWRIIYAIDDEEMIVDVLAVRQRPPYDYEDLDELFRMLQ